VTLEDVDYNVEISYPDFMQEEKYDDASGGTKSGGYCVKTHL